MKCSLLDETAAVCKAYKALPPLALALIPFAYDFILVNRPWLFLPYSKVATTC